MQDVFRFVKHDGKFCVAWTGARFNEPVIFTRYYPVSTDRSTGVIPEDTALEITLRPGTLISGGSTYRFNVLELKPGDVSVMAERRLERAVIVALDGETPVIETQPYPAPKTKLQTRYFQGRWEKLHNKRGWIPA